LLLGVLVVRWHQPILVDPLAQRVLLVQPGLSLRRFRPVPVTRLLPQIQLLQFRL